MDDLSTRSFSTEISDYERRENLLKEIFIRNVVDELKERLSLDDDGDYAALSKRTRQSQDTLVESNPGWDTATLNNQYQCDFDDCVHHRQHPSREEVRDSYFDLLDTTKSDRLWKGSQM